MCILPKSGDNLDIKYHYKMEGAHFLCTIKNEILKTLINEYDVKTTKDVQEM